MISDQKLYGGIKREAWAQDSGQHQRGHESKLGNRLWDARSLLLSPAFVFTASVFTGFGLKLSSLREHEAKETATAGKGRGRMDWADVTPGSQLKRLLCTKSMAFSTVCSKGRTGTMSLETQFKGLFEQGGN